MTDLGSLNYHLGIEIEQNKESITLSQGKYIKDLLVKFQMANCNKCATLMEVNCNLVPDEGEPIVYNTLYRQLIRSLIYLTATRPDISYSVGLVSRYMQEPRIRHWKTARRILRYLKGTIDLKLVYNKRKSTQLLGYCDFDQARDKENRRSTNGYYFFFGTTIVSWCSKKQPTIALSSTEAEYKSIVNTTCEALQLRQLLMDMNQQQQGPVKGSNDN